MDNTGRESEHDVFDLICGTGSRRDDDGSQFRTDSGEELEEEPRDKWQTNNGGEENVRQLTKSGEVYILSLW